MRTRFGVSAGSFEQRRGVLQGNPLSCALFNVFMDALVCKLAARPGYLVQQGGQQVQVAVLAYADDLAVLARSRAEARTQLRSAQHWLAACGMSLNARKCVYAATEQTHTLRLPGGDTISPLPRDAAWRYLGVTFTASLCWGPQRAALASAVGAAAQALGSRSLTGAQAAYYVRAVVLPSLAYRLVLGCATPSSVRPLQSALERMVRARAWLPHGLCSAALVLPPEHGGLGLGDLQAEVDGALVHWARALLGAPQSVAGRLFRMSLAAWQQRLGLPAQPLHRVAWLPSPAGGHRDSSRLLCVAVAAALERLGCDGLEAAATTLGPPQRGTPLCAVLPRTEWRALAPTLRRWRLQFVQQLLDADGRVRPYAHLHGGARAVQGAAVRAAPPWYARLVAALPAVPPPALDLSAPALGSLDVFCATLRVPAALAAHIAAAAARVTPASPLVAWTDGSAVLAAADQALLGTGAPAACGGAAVVFEACAEPADATVLACVAGAVSSYKCELVALLLALHIARDVPHLLLRTDSQAVVRALATQLAGTPPNPAAVCAAGRALRLADGELLLEAAAAVRARTARAFTTRLEWVRGHAGTLGNELADRAAAEARRLHPAAVSAAQQPVHTLGTSLVVGGRRLEGCVRRYARQRAVLVALEARTALREQGMAWSALVHAAPSAA